MNWGLLTVFPLFFFFYFLYFILFFIFIFFIFLFVQFCNDMYLMFDNAWLFNRKTSKVYKYCTKLCEVFEASIDEPMQRLGYCCGHRVSIWAAFHFCGRWPGNLGLPVVYVFAVYISSSSALLLWKGTLHYPTRHTLLWLPEQVH